MSTIKSKEDANYIVNFNDLFGLINDGDTTPKSVSPTQIAQSIGNNAAALKLASLPINQGYFTGSINSSILNNQPEDGATIQEENSMTFTGFIPEFKMILSHTDFMCYDAEPLVTSPLGSDWNGHETLFRFDPESGSTRSNSPGDNGGNAIVLEGFRGYEADLAVFTGEVQNIHAYDARCRNSGGTTSGNGTIGAWTSYYSHGLKEQSARGFITDFIGFHSDTGDETTAFIDGDWIGMRIDAPPSTWTFGPGAQYGIWVNGNHEGGDLVFGLSKQSKFTYNGDETSPTSINQFTSAFSPNFTGERRGYVFSPSFTGDAGSFDLKGTRFSASYMGGAATGKLISNEVIFRMDSSAQIDDITGLLVKWLQPGVGDILKLTGINVESATKNAVSTWTDQIGIQIDEQDQATNNYGLWLNGNAVGAGVWFGTTKQNGIYHDGTRLRIDGLTDAAITTETLQRYIEVNIGGTLRKLAIVA